MHPRMREHLDLPRLSVHEDVSGVRFYSDPSLEAACGVVMGFTERVGGLSAPPYESLNLGRFAGEGEEAAVANMRHLMSAVGAEGATLVNPVQVHGSNIVRIKEPAGPAFESAFEESQEGADALLITCPNVFAVLGFADCVPLIMVHSSGAFAVAHSGWRGTHARIASKTLDVLAGAVAGQEASADDVRREASEVNIYIGPYIHGECFQVGEDTLALFEEEFGHSVILPERHVDLGVAIRSDLVDHGADPARIVDVDTCTVCNVDRFFSYRAEDGTCGRHGAFAVRKES